MNSTNDSLISQQEDKEKANKISNEGMSDDDKDSLSSCSMNGSKNQRRNKK
jgi:hypothetical protein